MGILIGMDEAGYGPHLGPLAVAASAWYVPDEIWDAASRAAPRPNRRKLATATASVSNDSATTAVLDSESTSRDVKSRVDLYRVLRNVVCKTASDRRIPIADSKVLYSPSAGLRHLER